MARSDAARLEQELAQLERDHGAALGSLEAAYRQARGEPEVIELAAQARDSLVRYVGLVWVPYFVALETGQRRRAFRA